MKMASFRCACCTQALLACALALTAASPSSPEEAALCREPPAPPAVSLLQQRSNAWPPPEGPVHGAAPLLAQQAGSFDGDLVMAHIAYNFGHTVATVAFAESRGAIRWSLFDREIDAAPEVLGCPLRYAPQKYWPKDVAEKYFGSKKVFGIIRDPYERLVAQFRGSIAGYGGFGEAYREACDVNGAIKELLTGILNNTTDIFAQGCAFVPQSEYFHGDYGVQVPVDNRFFPTSMNEVFAAHNYSIRIRQVEIMHVHGCDNIWAGDLTSEVRHLVQTVYKADFDLLCKTFGYCDLEESVCLVEVPEMCPRKAFQWNMSQMRYVPTTSSPR